MGPQGGPVKRCLESATEVRDPAQSIPDINAAAEVRGFYFAKLQLHVGAGNDSNLAFIDCHCNCNVRMLCCS